MATPVSARNGLENLRVVVFREGDIYVAQCLEIDIATQADDLDSLLDRLEMTIESECQMSIEHGSTAFQGIGAAPAYFHNLWERGSMAIHRLNHDVGKHLPAMDARLAKAA